MNIRHGAASRQNRNDRTHRIIRVGGGHIGVGSSGVGIGSGRIGVGGGRVCICVGSTIAGRNHSRTDNYSGSNRTRSSPAT